MIDILILNATVVTVNNKKEIIENGGVAISGGRIVDVGCADTLKDRYSGIKVVDGNGKIIFPGLVNTHNHSYQSLLKGLGVDMVLSDWFTKMALPGVAALDQKSAYYGSMLCYVEGIRSGTTTMVDMFPHSDIEVCESVMKAFGDAGLRGIFARSYIDSGENFGIPPKTSDYIEKIEKDVRYLIEKYHGSYDGKLQLCLAPSQVWCNSPESLKMTKRLADEYKLGVTIHISETQFDRDSSAAYHGLSEMDTLKKYGLLGPKLLMVHCVLLNSQEVLLSKEFDVNISYNPVCNMYLSSGVAPIPFYLENGLTVGLATEGAGCNNSNDMIETLKFAVLLQKSQSRNPTVLTAEKALEMATIDGAKALGLENEIGSIEIGKKADLFIFNPMAAIKAVPLHDPVSTLVYSSSGANVETVIIDGKIVLENGLINFADENVIIKKSQQLADKLVEDANIGHLQKRPWPHKYR